MPDEPIDKVNTAIAMLHLSAELDAFIVSPADVKIVDEAITRLRTHRDELLEANNKYLIRAREAEYARDAAIRSVSFDNSDDRKDYLTQAIRDAHPVTTKNYKTYTQAQELVSNRYTKGALVNLVNYLLVQIEKSNDTQTQANPEKTD